MASLHMCDLYCHIPVNPENSYIPLKCLKAFSRNSLAHGIDLNPPSACSQLAEKVDLPQGGPKIMSKLEPPPLRGNLMNTLNSVAECSKTKDNSTSALAV